MEHFTKWFALFQAFFRCHFILVHGNSRRYFYEGSNQQKNPGNNIPGFDFLFCHSLRLRHDPIMHFDITVLLNIQPVLIQIEPHLLNGHQLTVSMVHHICHDFIIEF
jgi:hypothetical protein